MIAFPRLRRCTSAWVVVLALAGTAPFDAAGCGRDSDCRIGDRSYRILVPESHGEDAPPGAIIFVHGYRGTAAGVMQNDSLTALADELGLAFIAAQAAGPEWNIPDIPSADALQGVDELTYFDALMEDVVRRFGIDRSAILISGFSSGAMMVWHLACYRGDAFAGFVPISGTFWEPIPQSCPTVPSNLIHYHGEDDPVVPLHGRRIKDAHQGDVLAAIALVASGGDYRSSEREKTEELDCTQQVDSDGRLLELCLFAGKHEFKVRHLKRAARSMRLSESQ